MRVVGGLRWVSWGMLGPAGIALPLVDALGLPVLPARAVMALVLAPFHQGRKLGPAPRCAPCRPRAPLFVPWGALGRVHLLPWLSLRVFVAALGLATAIGQRAGPPNRTLALAPRYAPCQ